MEFLALAPLLFLVVVIAIIAGVIAAVRRGGDGEPEEPGIGTLKRVFYYLLSFITLGVAATGVTILLAVLLEKFLGDAVVSSSQNRLALGIALSVVGTPIWLWLWTRTLQAVRQYPGEARTAARKLYLFLVLGVAAALAAFGLVNVVQWLLGADDFSGYQTAIPLVTAGVWAFHWRTHAAEGQGRGIARSVPLLYIYITAFYGLVMLSVGLGMVLYHYVREAYDAVVRTELIRGSGYNLWGDQVRRYLAMAIVGGVWWVGHWGFLARRDAESALRTVYLYIFAVFGGVLTVVIALAFFIFPALQWLFGAPNLDAASEHFRVVPGVVAGFVIGAALWGYHALVIREETRAAPTRFQGARRGYEYLVAAVGLGTLAVGLVVVFAVAIGVLAPESGATVIGADSWKSPLALALTLIAIGAPLWGIFWSGLQKSVASDPTERARGSRRVFIYSVFGIALLVTLSDLSALLFVLIRDGLAGELSAQSIQDTRWFVAALLMAGAISTYHGLVLREDRRIEDRRAQEAGPSVPAAPRKRVVVLAPPDAGEAMRLLEQRLGYPVTRWRAVDAPGAAPVLHDAALRVLADAISQSPTETVMVIMDATGAHVYPYRVS